MTERSTRAPVGQGVVPAARRAQVVGAVVDGMALATLIVHAATHLDLSPTQAGAWLAGAAALAALGAVPLGRLADRVGIRRVAVPLGLLSAFALTAYGLGGSAAAFGVGTLAFAVAQSGLVVLRNAAVASVTAPAERVRARATMHTLLNAGVGTGTLLGVGLLAVADETLLRVAYLIAAAAGVLTTLWLRRLPGAVVARSARTALGERYVSWPLLRVTGLAGLVQLTMPVLSVILPAWVLTRMPEHLWAAAAAFTLNTVLVLLVQRRIAARVRTNSDAARGALLAGAAALVACLALAGSGRGDGLALVLLGLGIVALTAAETVGGAVTWQLALRDVPQHAQGRANATFSLATSVARVLGPLVMLPLVLGLGLPGWLIVGGTIALACLLLAAIARRAGATLEPCASPSSATPASASLTTAVSSCSIPVASPSPTRSTAPLAS